MPSRANRAKRSTVEVSHSLDVNKGPNPSHITMIHPSTTTSTLNMANSEPDPSNLNTVHLDGRTLEGGGQLVRNAVVLSVLSGQAVAIHNIRGNRLPKTGLKTSHMAEIRFLGELSEAEVIGAEVGSSSLHFSPQKKQHSSDGEPSEHYSQKLKLSLPQPKPIQPEYNIRLPTAGSVFLVFQALYPYLMYASAFQGQQIQLNLTGGTNVSFSPSYDYVSQVLVPNFARLGLPRLDVQLRKRGWATGPVDLGTVTFFVHPLATSTFGTGKSDLVGGEAELETSKDSNPRFPVIDTNKYLRGKITRIEVTILGPDRQVRPGWEASEERSTRDDSNQSSSYNHGDAPDGDASNQPETLSQLIQNETLDVLREKLVRLGERNPSIFEPNSAPNGPSNDPVPIDIHTSEQTHHLSHAYILIVAHTSTGFRLGRDALFGTEKDEKVHPQKGKRGHKKQRETLESKFIRLTQRCVRSFIEEIGSMPFGSRKSCLDMHMRDQVVIFEALGKLNRCEREKGLIDFAEEDERDWSLHTRTARWVCEEVLGVKW